MKRRHLLARAMFVAAFVVAAFFAFSGSALAADNSACLTCHQASMSMSVTDVNRDTACKSCHLNGFVGTHPYHQSGSDCGAACHPGWGDSIMTAIPSYTDPVSGASFASASSKATSPAILHIIHSAARWPQNVNTSFSACSSCHAAAACTACHTGAVSASHADHSATGNASYPARTPWTGLMGHGVTGSDQTQQTAAVETNQCAISGCHDIEGTRSRRPNDVEDYNYAVGVNPEDPTGTNSAITLVGTWRYKASSMYSGLRMSYNNVAGSALTATFTGERVDLVSDKDPYRGKADVYIDGAKVATIDTYAAATVNQAVVYSSGTLAGGPTHTISVRPLNTRSASARATYVVVDAFRVYASVPDSIAPGCLDSCHADKSTGHGATFSHEATHTVGVESGFACTECHSLNMFTEHGRTSSSSDAASCNACHTTYAPFTLAEYDFTCGGTGNPLDTATQPCHSNAGQARHEFMATGHDASGVAAGAECKGCHGSDLATVHTAGSGRAYDAALTANTYATSCLTCHSATAVPTTKDCTSSLCHSASFGGAAVTMDNHKPVAHPATNNGQTDVPTTGGFACSTCHTLELSTEHAKASSVTSPGGAAIKCSTCHSAVYLPTDWNDTPGTTNTCTACHPVAGGEAGAPHEASEYASKHDLSTYGTNASCGSTTMACHSGSTELLGDMTDVTGLHAASKPGNADCTSCHGTGGNKGNPPTVKACATCHTISHDTGPAHNSSAALVPDNAACLGCHTNYTNIMFGHPFAFDCQRCHDNATLTAGSTRYLGGTFTTRCLDCHTGTVLGAVYDPTDPNHYDPHLDNHTATGMTAAVGTKTCQDCHANTLKAEHVMTVSAGLVDCIDCHVDTTLGSATVVANNWPNDECSDCHTATHDAISASHTLAGNADCGGAGCHTNTDNLATLHSGAVDGSSRTSCNVCHTTGADTDLSSVTGCDSCHAPHDMSVHVSQSSQECVDCHGDADVRNVHASAAEGPCAVCHDNSTLGNLSASNTAECVSCHGDEVGTHAYTPADPNHYDETLHATTDEQSAAWFYCSDCHQMPLAAEHQVVKAQGTEAADGSVTCVECHSNAYAADVVASDWALNVGSERLCADCHNDAGLGNRHQARSLAHESLADPSCEGADCHAGVLSSDVETLHYNAVDGDGNQFCKVCHTNGADTDLSGITTCTDCHAGHDFGVHAVTTDTGSCLNCHGDDGTPANDVRGVHASCATCHDNPSYPGITTGKTSDCTSCHNSTLVAEPDAGSGGNYNPYATNHYVGSETTHTVSIGQGGTLYDGYTCQSCHQLEMKPEHFKTTSLVPGADKCVGCHEVKVDALGTWDKTCDACHTAVPHDERTTKHDVTASSCTADSGCHSNDISVIHAESIPTNSMHPSCATCHTNNTTLPTELSCGAVGCHAGMSAHSHTLADSTYNNTTVAGCTDSGAGCHGAAPANYADIHPSNGCTSGACHAAANHNDALFNDPNTCQDCHGGGAVLYDGAPDVVGLMDTGTTGHYNETTHTATGMTNVVRGTTNGTASATCTNCHNGASAGPDGYYAQHQGVRTGSLTCSDCHNKNAAIQGIVTDATRTDTCAACHNGTIVEAQGHTTNAPAATGTSTAGCATTAIGCHTSNDLHELHKNAAGGCNLTGCHDYTKQGVKPTIKTCGQATGCHTSDKYTATSHNGTGGLADGTDADHHTAGTTQTTALYTYNSKSAACSACHSGVLGTEHGRSTSTLSGTGADNCAKCHNDSATVANVVKGSWANKNTTSACSDCHANTDGTSAATAHANVANHAVGTTNTGCTGLGAGCHGTAATPDLTTVHTTGCALTRACHSPTVFNPTAKTCSNASCHPTATYNTTTYAHNTVTGTDATHQATSGMTTTLKYGTGTASSTCATCHSDTLKPAHNFAAGYATASLGWTNECTGCHNATTPLNVAALVTANGWTHGCATNSCHNTTQQAHIDGGTDAPAVTGVNSTTPACVQSGCHSTLDLHELHKDAAGGCTLSDTNGACHTAAFMDKRPTQKTCGNTGGCHEGKQLVTHGYDPAKHLSSGSASVTGYAFADTSGCNPCHYTNVYAATIGGTDGEHAKLGLGCDACHGTGAPANVLAIASGATVWDKTCQQCHTGGAGYASAVHGATDGNLKTTKVATPSDSTGFPSTTTWNGTNSGWAGHRVRTGYRAYVTSWTNTQLMTAWNRGALVNSTTMKTNPRTGLAWTGSDAVYCTDCHGDYSAAGPHGAAVTVNLKSGKVWNNTVTWSTSGLLCVDCHTANAINGGHKKHGTGGSGVLCWDCHISIPHGYKRPALLLRSGLDVSPFNRSPASGGGLMATSPTINVSTTNAAGNPTSSMCQAGCTSSTHGTKPATWIEAYGTGQ